MHSLAADSIGCFFYVVSDSRFLHLLDRSKMHILHREGHCTSIYITAHAYI